MSTKKSNGGPFVTFPPARIEINFCSRCGARLTGVGVHTCSQQRAITDNGILRQRGARLLEKVANEAPGDSVWKLFSARAENLRSGKWKP